MTSALRWPVVVVMMLVPGTFAHGQDVPLEYRLKAAYLLNFTRFIEWPSTAGPRPFAICIAGQNPFGEALAATFRGEAVGTRPIDVRVLATPQLDCDMLFVPHGAAATPFIRAVRGSPTLTVGESPRFTAQGGMINFLLQEGTVRFEINPVEAERAGLRISSHLLRLARMSDR